MSWNGTVTCRHCWNKGHNTRTCPKLTEQWKRRAEDEVANGDGLEGYWTQKYVKRTGLYPDGTQAPKSAKPKQKRRCKYCAATGHNTRTCQVLKTDKAAYVEEVIAYRVKLLEGMKEVGCGVGALLKTERWDDIHCWLITKIKWNLITEQTVGNGDLLVGQNIKETRGGYNSQSTLNFPKIAGVVGETWSKSEVVGPVPVSEPPADWFTAEGCAGVTEQRFENGKSACYHDNYYA